MAEDQTNAVRGDENVGVTRRTEVVAIDPHHPDPDTIEHAASILRAGGLVAFPTETVYGLGADACSGAAVRSVFEAKGRPATDPLIVHLGVAPIGGQPYPMLDRVVKDWPATAERLALHFWPGPLTLIVPRGDGVAVEVGAELDTVAVRVPAHAAARALIVAAGRPIAAPSANRFGRVSPTTAAHVLEELDGRIDLVLDGGPTALGVESSVVDLVGPVPALLRPGGVTLEDLVEVLGEVRHEPRRVVAEEEAASGPGQLLRHYSPSTPVVLVDGDRLVVDELLRGLQHAGVTTARVSLPDDAASAARALYSSLRAGDALGVQVLLAPVLAPDGLGRAVNDRLFRAAHGRVVDDAGVDTVARLAALVTPTDPALTDRT